MDWDHIIVGAGSAGCVMAKRLSEAGGRKVLLLEAGGRDSYHWVHIPVGYLYCIGNPRTDWMFRTADEPVSTVVRLSIRAARFWAGVRRSTACSICGAKRRIMMAGGKWG